MKCGVDVVIFFYEFSHVIIVESVTMQSWFVGNLMSLFPLLHPLLIPHRLPNHPESRLQHQHGPDPSLASHPTTTVPAVLDLGEFIHRDSFRGDIRSLRCPFTCFRCEDVKSKEKWWQDGAEGLRSPRPSQTARQEDCPRLEGSCRSSCDLSGRGAVEREEMVGRAERCFYGETSNHLDLVTVFWADIFYYCICRNINVLSSKEQVQLQNWEYGAETRQSLRAAGRLF